MTQRRLADAFGRRIGPSDAFPVDVLLNQCCRGRVRQPDQSDSSHKRDLLRFPRAADKAEHHRESYRQQRRCRGSDDRAPCGGVTQPAPV
jgi:hypothetical protein